MTEAGALIGYVFGYGSLILDKNPPEDGAGEIVAPDWVSLRGYRRRWNIAMDNSAPTNDGKYFVDEATGERPSIYIAWLNIERASDMEANGLAIPVSHQRLAELDEREASYERIEVTAKIDPRPDLPVWTYIGNLDATRRFEQGKREGRMFIGRVYVERIRAAFAEAGSDALASFERSTAPLECPQRSLRLVRPDRDGRK